MDLHLVEKVKDFIHELDRKGGKPLYELTPEQARQVLIDVQKFPAAAPQTDVEKLIVPFEDKITIPVKIFRPKGFKEALPVIFYIHGGGWVLGNDQTHERLVKELSACIPAAVVFPVYTPSPEAVFPHPTAELFVVLKHIAQNAAAMRFDPDRIAVAGDSVGGNMAAVMTLMAKDAHLPKICFQALFYPVTSADMTTGSYALFENGPWLSKKAMRWFWDNYAPEKKDRESIFASPLKASEKQLRGLPPALVITAENDVLRDEGEAYAHKLADTGVDVTAVRFNGTIHDFMVLNPITESDPTRTAILMTIAKLRAVFGIA
ncbi:MAG: alpha/beta hydrolase [Alphaproteobacteria bacterium]|nr:alpha/beta hydrolase [Alphaproteobacteria bacterium]